MHNLEGMPPLLSVRGLSKAFEGDPAVENFNLDLFMGERLMLFAASGTGKTTLLRLLQNLISPDCGEICYRDGIKPRLLFQEPRLFPSLTLFENILLPLNAKSPTKDKIERLCYWLAETGLAESKNKYPKELSGGMKRKTSLLRALVDLPDLILMDEPFQSLDLDSKKVFTEKIIPSMPEMTIFFTSHDLSEANLFASSVLYVEGDRLHSGKRYSPADFLQSLPTINLVNNRNSHFGNQRGEL